MIHTMGRIEARQAFARREVGENINEFVVDVAYFVIENLPSIPFLKKMAEDKTKRIITIGDEKWQLSVSDDEGIVSSGKKGNMKLITFTKKKAADKKIQRGIFIEEDFGLVLGSILGDNVLIPFKQPTNLAELTKELKRDNTRMVRESLIKTQDIHKTTVELNLRPCYVSRITSASK